MTNEKPYAYLMTVVMYDGATNTIVRVAKTENHARSQAILKSRVSRVESMVPLSKEEYEAFRGIRGTKCPK
jgi:hypothetical protein